jgi:DNA-binding transcriptional regulator YhcF (GntR family)
MHGMRLWFARGNEVTLREQLVTQVILGILSDELRPGERLPSTRAIARRFHFHPNTVSAAYKQLEQEGWLESRKGSGVFVREAKTKAPHSAKVALDESIAEVFRTAGRLGLPVYVVRARLRHWMAMQTPNRFLLIEPDAELRRIVKREIERAVTLPVEGCDLAGQKLRSAAPGTIPVALPTKVKSALRILPAGTEVLALQVRSVTDSLAQWLPAPTGALVGVASRWLGFLKMARTMLVAAGFHPDSLVMCDTRDRRRLQRLKPTAAVVCDVVTAAELPNGCRAVIFPLLSDACVTQLKQREQQVRGDRETRRAISPRGFEQFPQM